MFHFILLLVYIVKVCFSIVCDPKPGTPVNKPMGKGRGVNPGRVAWNWNKDACTWDGKTDYYYNPDFLNYTLVSEMLDDSIKALAGEKTSEDAWTSIFQNFNLKRTNLNRGYTKGEKIAIKVNLNVDFQSYTATADCNSVSPQFLKALIHQLVDVAGVDQPDITVYDAARWFQVQYWEPPVGFGTDYPDVNVRDTLGGMDYVKAVEVDEETMFYLSNRSVDGWNLTKLPKCLTEAKYVIELDAFRGHTLAGVTATGKNWFGSIWNPTDWNSCSKPTEPPGHWCPMYLHEWVNVTGEQLGPVPFLEQRPMSVYNPLVDLLGHDDTAGKGLIFFADAMYGGYTQACTDPIKFQIPPFSGSWSCSNFVSQDPIALDSVLFDFLRSEPQSLQPYPNIGCTDNYLHEGALADDPPSGVDYAPSGRTLDSLGVHEHWNNPQDKQYSRNLKIGDGIELVKVFEL